MRDNHSGYTEILGTFEQDGLYFGIVRVTVAGEEAAFEFGVEQRSYVALKRILQSHPFDPLGKYRYFFTGTFSKKEPGSDTVTIGIRIEEGTNGKGFDFKGPTSLVSNLLWFQSLKSFQEAASLKRLVSNDK